MEVRLVTANTRDGADTRNQDVVTCLGGGDQERVGQTAAMYLEDFKKHRREQEDAAKTIQNWFRAFPKIPETGTFIAEEEDYGKCLKCNERRIGMFIELCADCYWSEDAYLKSMRRNAIPSHRECEACHKTSEMAHDGDFCWDCFEALQEWEDAQIDSYERRFDHEY